MDNRRTAIWATCIMVSSAVLSMSLGPAAAKGTRDDPIFFVTIEHDHHKFIVFGSEQRGTWLSKRRTPRNHDSFGERP